MAAVQTANPVFGAAALPSSASSEQDEDRLRAIAKKALEEPLTAEDVDVVRRWAKDKYPVAEGVQEFVDEEFAIGMGLHTMSWTGVTLGILITCYTIASPIYTALTDSLVYEAYFDGCAALVALRVNVSDAAYNVTTLPSLNDVQCVMANGGDTVVKLFPPYLALVILTVLLVASVLIFLVPMQQYSRRLTIGARLFASRGVWLRTRAGPTCGCPQPCEPMAPVVWMYVGLLFLSLYIIVILSASHMGVYKVSNEPRLVGSSCDGLDSYVQRSGSLSFSTENGDVWRATTFAFCFSEDNASNPKAPDAWFIFWSFVATALGVVPLALILYPPVTHIYGDIKAETIASRSFRKDLGHANWKTSMRTITFADAAVTRMKSLSGSKLFRREADEKWHHAELGELCGLAAGSCCWCKVAWNQRCLSSFWTGSFNRAVDEVSDFLLLFAEFCDVVPPSNPRHPMTRTMKDDRLLSRAGCCRKLQFLIFLYVDILMVHAGMVLCGCAPAPKHLPSCACICRLCPFGLCADSARMDIGPDNIFEDGEELARTESTVHMAKEV
jgi:uncharacterized protein YaiE (UPF0345 family)